MKGGVYRMLTMLKQLTDWDNRFIDKPFEEKVKEWIRKTCRWKAQSNPPKEGGNC